MERRSAIAAPRLLDCQNDLVNTRTEFLPARAKVVYAIPHLSHAESEHFAHVPAFLAALGERVVRTPIPMTTEVARPPRGDREALEARLRERVQERCFPQHVAGMLEDIL
jgi:hypothetical protein